MLFGTVDADVGFLKCSVCAPVVTLNTSMSLAFEVSLASVLASPLTFQAADGTTRMLVACPVAMLKR